MEEGNYEFRSDFNERYNVVTRKILRALSENSRVSISDLAKSLGISRMTARLKLKRVAEEFNIHYTVEFNENLLRLVAPHLIAVKFEKKPDYAHVARLLSQTHIPQIAVSMRGGYDMLVYAVARTTREYAHWDKSMQILLSEYGVDWKPSEVVHRQLGFFPLRDKLLDRLDIPEGYKGMLKILHANSRTPFRYISKELGMHFNTVAYNFNKLLKAGYVKRFTITSDKPDTITLMSFFAKYKPTEGYESSSAQARKAFMSDDQNSLVSRYLVCAPLIGSYDFFTLGAFDNSDTAYKKDIQYHRSCFKKHGIRMVHGEVDRVILGSLPIRSVDTRKEYNKIVWDPQASDA
jgi:DNA-binding Lrp family transcriptional regulator